MTDNNKIVKNRKFPFGAGALKMNYELKKLTRMAMGGPAEYFVTVSTEKDLANSVQTAKTLKLPWTIVGDGSNLIVSDRGVKGFTIRNQYREFFRKGNAVTVGAGNNLLQVIRKLNKLGLAGMERMAGIPGTFGGAIYGCAGAYGQEIRDRLVKVRFYDGRRFRSLSRAQCHFGYRDSIFKKNKNWVISSAQFRLGVGEPMALQKISREIIKKREKKYPPGLRCPGSFFKNLKVAEVKPVSARRTLLKKIPKDAIMYGKVPVGYLLEQVSAKGLRQGQIYIARHHANLIFNPKNGRSEDVRLLADRLKKLVKRKYGVKIEEEVQYLGFTDQKPG